MKVNLSCGEAQVDIHYDTEQLLSEKLQEQFPQGVRSTKLLIALPSGEKLETKCVCHTSDVFNRKQGRRAALLKLFDVDTGQAIDAALDDFKNSKKKTTEEESLNQAAKKHYRLSRPDRRIISEVVCPEFSKNPNRRIQSEKAILAKLKAKYEKDTDVSRDEELVKASKFSKAAK